MSIFSTVFFVQDFVILLMGFGFGCAVSSIFKAPRWLVDELTK